MMVAENWAFEKELTVLPRLWYKNDLGVCERQKRWQRRVDTEARGVSMSSHIVFHAA